MRGNSEQLTALFSYLDPVKRQQVAAALPPQSLAEAARRCGGRDASRQPQQVIIGDLKEGKVFRALYSNRQLEEVLVDFWFNHFNVVRRTSGQPTGCVMLGSYERDAIRPHVLGHFKDLLLATARHPAMLYYLDNWESMSPDAFDIGPFAPRPGQACRIRSRAQAHGLNENYGRELMELHTLGVDGGYTQAGRDRGGALLHRVDRSEAADEAGIRVRAVHARYRERRWCWVTRSRRAAARRMA